MWCASARAQRQKQGPERLSGASTGSSGTPSRLPQRQPSVSTLQLAAAANLAHSFESDCSMEVLQ